ncbi:MAG: phage tail protein [Porticoccaceae bacterium]|nr:phage tail protein [Porticoccaceae bacterium]
MPFSIRYEFKDIDQLAGKFDPKHVETAAYSAAQRTARSARTRIKRKVREIYTVRAGDLDAASTIRRVDSDRYAYVIRYVGGLIGLDKFGMRTPITRRKGRKKYRGLSVQVKKQGARKIIKSGFAADVNGMKAFERAPHASWQPSGSSGKHATLPIKRLMGPSVPQMVGSTDVLADVERFVEEEMPKQFNSALNALLRRTGGA